MARGLGGWPCDFCVRRQLGADKATGPSFANGEDAFASIRSGEQFGLLVALVTDLIAVCIEQTLAQRAPRRDTGKRRSRGDFSRQFQRSGAQSRQLDQLVDESPLERLFAIQTAAGVHQERSP